MKYIVISIPVHEKVDVVTDQIKNIKRYVPNAYIVLHINSEFAKNEETARLYHMEDVLVNPIHLDTQWGDIVEPHISNFRFAQTKVKFKYFVLHSSNDLYVKEGFADYIQNYNAGFAIRKVKNKYSHWWPGNMAMDDPEMSKLMNICGQNEIIATQVESSFYRYDLMEKIVNTIEQVKALQLAQNVYTREEIYFSTVASAYVDWNRVGNVTTFSEVHRFDRRLWKIREHTRKLYWKCGLHRIINEKTYYAFESWYNDVLFKSKFYQLSCKDVKRIVNNDRAYISRNCDLNDGSGKFQLYDSAHIYSVKRVPRDMNNPVRKYIRSMGLYIWKKERNCKVCYIR